MSSQDAIVVKLGLTPEQLIGYAYAGLLAAFIAGNLEPKQTQDLINVLGGFLATTVALALGVGIYVLYFKLLGEFVLYPFQHLVHWGIDRSRGKTGLHQTSCVRYLGALGVPVGQRRAAYEGMKSLFFQERDRRRVQVAHGELHVLYLTAVESTAAGVYLHFHGLVATPWFVAAIIVYIAALLGDLRQHTLESFMLKARSEADIRGFLTAAGFIGSNAA